MGREIDDDDNDVEFERYHHHHPGCMAAIFDYHHWYNVKKMFHYRKYNRGRHVRCCANPRTISMERELIETQGLLHAEVDHFQVPQQTRNTSLTISNSSNKASTKGFSARPELLQMCSTHHLEHSCFGFGWMNPVILINMRTNTSGMSSTSSSAEGKTSTNTSGMSSTSSSAEGKTSDSPRTRYLRFSTLEHKQKEVWSFRNGEKKQVAGTQSSQGSDSQKRNCFVMNRLKDFKQRVKQAIKESKKGTNQDGTDHDINNGGLNRMSRTKSINESLDRCKESFKHGAHNGPKSISIGEGIDKFELVEAVIEAELQENMREVNNHDDFSSTCLSMETNGEDIAKPCDLAMEETSPHQEQECVCEDNPSREQEVDLCYNYVRDILELSGLLQNQCLHSWYSPHQPLNPLETLLHPELEHCSIDDHQLVLDLVNEALVVMSETARVHKFPKPFNRGIGLMLKGNAVLLQEVWRYVSGNMGFQQERDRSLDGIVGRDMEKDGWMFLQGEDDFVGLELQELVFDGLLDELLCNCFSRT